LLTVFRKQLTGRLPLTIGIVAGLIREFTDEEGWATIVLEMLQEDRQGAMASEEGGLSPSELVVQRSLDQLTAQDPKELFQLLSACPEDASIPVGAATMIWQTRDKATSTKPKKLALKVRKMMSVLLNSGLFMGTSSLITIHDIGK
jgi:hypothetical protein